MLEKIKDGDGIGFDTLYKNKIEHFKIVLLKRKSEFTGEKSYEYGFLNKNRTLYTRGCYTGGDTGFGASGIQKIEPAWHNCFKIVTKAIPEMNQIANKLQKIKECKKKQYDKKMTEKVETINKLPKKYLTYYDILDKAGFYFERTPAEYRPSYSHNITGGNIFLCNKIGRNIYLDYYVTRDNKLQYQKFAREIKYSTGFEDIIDKIKNPKLLLLHLVMRWNDYRDMINKIKNS